MNPLEILIWCEFNKGIIFHLFFFSNLMGIIRVGRVTTRSFGFMVFSRATCRQCAIGLGLNKIANLFFLMG